MGMGQGFSQLASGVLKIGYGNSQSYDANKRLKRLGELPDENIPPEVLENKTNAEIGAETGLPAAQYTQAMRNILRQQTSAIKAGQDRRMAGALIGGVQQNTNSATLGLDVQNALARERNQQRLAGANNQIGMWRHRIYENFLKNKYIPQFNYAMSEKGAGNANQMAGLDSVIAGGSSLAGGGSGGGGGGLEGLGGLLGGGGGSSSGGGGTVEPYTNVMI